MYSINYYTSYLLEFSSKTENPMKLGGGFNQFSSENVESRTIDYYIELFEVVELMSFDDDEMISIYHNFIFYELKKKKW